MKSQQIRRTSKPDGRMARTQYGGSSETRRGTSMLELVVGAVLVGVFVTGAVPMLRWVHISSQFNEQHRLATQELANQMEQLAALPPERVTAEYLQTLQPSADTQASLPDVQFTATSAPADAGMQRITCELTWANSALQQNSPVRLTAWFPAPTKGEATSDPETP